MRICVVSILVVAALLRFTALGSNPAGVFHDEAEKGYSAWCLTQVGGTLQFTNLKPNAEGVPVPTLHRWPLFVDVWGSLTSMVYQYAAAPFVGLFGLSAWTTRLPAAIIGTLTVLLAFFLARGLTGQSRVAIWAMALMTFSPWHLVFSRWAQQGIFVPFFVTAGILFLLRSERLRTVWMLPAALCFGLAFYSYSGAQPFLLLFLPYVALLWRRELARNWKISLCAAALLLILVSPTLYATFGRGGAGMGRLTAVSVFSLDAPPLAKALLLLKNYFSHFSPQFLFLTGDALPRHGFPWFGEMLHVEIPFLIAGIYTAAKRRTKGDLLLIGWFVLFPVGAAITNEGIPHALRTLNALPCPQILSAIGAVEVLNWIRQKWGRNARLALLSLCVADAALLVFVLFARFPAWSGFVFEEGLESAIHSARQAGTRDYVLYVSAEAGYPMIPELFYFHERTSPQELLTRGSEASHIRFLPADPPLSEVPSLLRPGDTLLASPRMMSSPPADSLRVHPVFLPGPYPPGIPRYVLISR